MFVSNVSYKGYILCALFFDFGFVCTLVCCWSDSFWCFLVPRSVVRRHFCNLCGQNCSKKASHVNDILIRTLSYYRKTSGNPAFNVSQSFAYWNGPYWPQNHPKHSNGSEFCSKVMVRQIIQSVLVYHLTPC